MVGIDTIYALSSGSLPAGIAVVRISGPQAFAVLQALTGQVPPSRQATLCRLSDADGAPLDRALVLTFPEGASFTGEAVVELHLHGGKAVVQAVLAAISAQPHTRPAEAGEFTKRGFLNGRMDLTAAEAIQDLIAAETEAQRRLALRNAEGGQSQLYGGWRSQLIEARALLEADLDFADEGDVPGSVAGSVAARVELLRTELASHLSHTRTGEILRDGYRVVIMGAPNAGKSSLINYLAKREIAIVSDEAGTTRDLLEVALDIQGFKVVLTDTAGLRDTQSRVEQMGIDRAIAAGTRADLVLHLHPCGSDHPKLEVSAPILEVASKSDLARHHRSTLAISTVTGEGVDVLLSEIFERLQVHGDVDALLPTQQRQVALLGITLQHLEQVNGVEALELQAEHLRLAADALGRVTGAIGVEDLLDVIFSQFCIGK